MYLVRDGERALQFDGELLSSSSSGGFGRTRWIEFNLYRTAGGSYVLSRIGRSLYYHDLNCGVVRRNKISPVEFGSLDSAYLPCDVCEPTSLSATDEVCPEQPRYWAQLSESAEGVVASLYKYDASGARYLTNVARRLLLDAATNDSAIRDEFLIERID